MSKFLALIMVAAMALFIAGPAMAVDVTKSVDNSNTASTTFNTDVTVTKSVDVSVSGDLKATGGVNVQGDSIFKEMDVNVQDQEAVVKFFEIDDSAHSSWVVNGLHGLNALEQIQNGEFNRANISQLGTPIPDAGNPSVGSDKIMNVGLQYQVGDVNTAGILQTGAGWPVLTVDTNNFAKQVQIGDLNSANITQNKRSLR